MMQLISQYVFHVVDILDAVINAVWIMDIVHHALNDLICIIDKNLEKYSTCSISLHDDHV